MGEVWLAERSSAGKHSQLVAVKFLGNASKGGTLAAEALRMSRLSHDNIVPFIDSGHDAGGRFFIAMSYVRGVDLEDLRDLVGITKDAAYLGQIEHRVPDQIVGFVMFMVLRALQYAHTYDFGDGVIGLIHRDVSPGNILIDEARGFVKLTDFGVAVKQSSKTMQTDIAGKVPYMAKEVLTGGAVDIRSDLYALGLVAYELLTGINPNVHPAKLVSVVSAITDVMISLEKPLRPPHEVIRGIDTDLSKIVVRLLATSPEERYSSAESVIADLSIYLYDHGVGPTTESLAQYIQLVRNPKLEISKHARRDLGFLTGQDNEIDVFPRWELTPQAARALAAGLNPGRVSDG
ncbi:MAG: serine/threonine protein kinase [Deltaproteobacteria bacterium]|nr:serine/threonine protein kinase [Deltaproteobacteria bacterium]